MSTAEQIIEQTTAEEIAGDTTWSDWGRDQFQELVKYIVLNPYDFLFYLFLFLSPLFLISAYLSYKMLNMMDKTEKKKNKKSVKAKNVAKTRRAKHD